VAKETMGRALQVTGKDLNDNKTSKILANLTANLSKHGLRFDSQGNIIQG
jgi:hypothetical protein